MYYGCTRCKQKGSAQILVLIGFLILVVIIGGGYFAGKFQILKPQSANSPATSLSSPVPDETANWKVYTNTKYGYSMKYPADWIIKFKCNGRTEKDDSVCFLSPDLKQDAYPRVIKGGLIIVNTEIPYSPESLDKFCESTPPAFPTTDCKQIKVDSLLVWQSTTDFFTNFGILKDRKFLFPIRLEYAPESKTETLKLFNQILSTFKFSDKLNI